MKQPRSLMGFTLIELLITVTIASILLTIAVPGFTNFIRASRADVQSTSLVNSFSYARSEAIKRAQSVHITALNSADWHLGWRIWADMNGNGTYETSEELKQYSAFSGDATLTNENDDPEIVFLKLGNIGGLEGAPGGAVEFEYRVGEDYCRLERNITINHLGRVIMERRPCP